MKLYLQVQELLSLARDYTHELSAGVVEVQEGLRLSREITSGLRMQDKRLELLSELFQSELPRYSDVATIDAFLFDALRDLFSLHPSNPTFVPLFGCLFRMLSGEAIDRLHADCSNQVLVAHVSCRAREDRARASIHSFPSDLDGTRHLIVVGDPSHAHGGFSVRYDGERIELPCRDSYEGHCEKCLHFYALLSSVSMPRLVYKLDDDVHLDDSDLFLTHIEDLLSRSIPYAGHVVSGWPHHRQMWHGWHLGKCLDKTFEAIGCQVPVASAFADGGFGYALAPQALEELSYAFFAHRASLEVPSIMYEDTTVGLFLQLAGIVPECIDYGATGLTSERHLMQLDLHCRWREYVDYEKRLILSLESHSLWDAFSSHG
ncbi:hypothetical protein [Synechococcus sp. GFB01]|uniref:hypothetical protein n=1 Tax=Synechococcus sp. GFB01 TaxID=1662190 RepID=UPI00128B80C0|nr:hypothetical protein [Synechococcus sp. GFB01]